MKTNKITPELIRESIEKEKNIFIQKMEMYEQVKDLNSALKALYESSPLVTSFGFQHPNDGMNKTVTGFQTSPNISYINQLEMDMNEEDQTQINEVESLKQENEKLKKELENLKASSVK